MEDQARVGLTADPLAAKPLLGRDDERAFLEDLFSTVENGFGRALVLYGDAGMGKTRVPDASRYERCQPGPPPRRRSAGTPP